jgi:hypothetical protein
MTDLKRAAGLQKSAAETTSRREFIQATAAGAALPAAALACAPEQPAAGKSQVFRVNACPVHDGRMRHAGVDAMLHLLATHGTRLYKTGRGGALNGRDGLIAVDDVVVVKVNAQWKCRGTTNTDMLRGLIHRILQHPDGFRGEVVIFENGQQRPAAFDGIRPDSDKTEYRPFPELEGKVRINAEEEDLLTIDYLTGRVFRGKPVSSFLMDPYARTFIASDDHQRNGYRRIGEPKNKRILLPLGGNSAASHDPDNNPRLASVYAQAREAINAAGGIRGRKAETGDDRIEVIEALALNRGAAKAWKNLD